MYIFFPLFWASGQDSNCAYVALKENPIPPSKTSFIFKSQHVLNLYPPIVVSVPKGDKQIKIIWFLQ